jgi:hypothetical protein
LRTIEQQRISFYCAPARAWYELWQEPDHLAHLQTLSVALFTDAPSLDFLTQLHQMSPSRSIRIGTALSVREASGMVLYTALQTEPTTADERNTSRTALVATPMPVYQCRVRKPLLASTGMAGEELGIGEIGELTFRGPQTCPVPRSSS